LLLGCNSTPAGIDVPDFDPAAATAAAMSQYDANGDQKLVAEELKDCPGLKATLSRFDASGDGAVAAEELTSQLNMFRQQAASLVTVSCTVRQGGRPLAGAKVEYVPESFLGGAIKPAVGITGPDGRATPTIAEEFIPAEYRGRIAGVHCGIFRVVVTHPTVKIPAKFNAQTEIGRMVTRRDDQPLEINL
jgi:hypothetical protein